MKIPQKWMGPVAVLAMMAAILSTLVASYYLASNEGRLIPHLLLVIGLCLLIASVGLIIERRKLVEAGFVAGVLTSLGGSVINADLNVGLAFIWLIVFQFSLGVFILLARVMRED